MTLTPSEIKQKHPDAEFDKTTRALFSDLDVESAILNFPEKDGAPTVMEIWFLRGRICILNMTYWTSRVGERQIVQLVEVALEGLGYEASTKAIKPWHEYLEDPKDDKLLRFDFTEIRRRADIGAPLTRRVGDAATAIE